MRVSVVGATGMVGQIILKVLAERSFPVTELIPVASERSVGMKVAFGGQNWTVVSLADAVAAAPDVACFRRVALLRWSGPQVLLRVRVVDNSSAWRMDSDKKLVVQNRLMSLRRAI